MAHNPVPKLGPRHYPVRYLHVRPDVTLEKILDYRRQGMGNCAIATALNANVRTIYQRLESRGYTGRRKRL